MLPLSNTWLDWIWAEYSRAIMLVPSAVAFTLKLVAIAHPRVQSDRVRDLFHEYWPRKKAPNKGEQ